jgi:outer membrane lipoprotein SlyB
MSRIVAGRFDRSVDADAALEHLKRDGFARSEVDAFYVGPPGQHARTPIGGDVYSDAGARGAGRSGVIGAVAGLVAGLIIGSLIGTHVVLLACGLGALAGAFAGVMVSLRGGTHAEATREHPVEPRGGRMIAVCVDRPDTEQLAVDALRANNARNVGRTEGDWRDGGWRDFDPRTPLATV